MTENKSTIIYKYRNIDERLYEMLIKHSLWLAKPSTFNDPFDCNLSFSVDEASLNRFVLNNDDEETVDLRTNYSLNKKSLGVERLKEMLIENVTKVIANTGICCFNSDQRELLPWAHYADSHRGVCLGFDYTELNFEGRCSVKYEDNYPVINLMDVNKAIKKLLTTKSIQWEKEKEVRYIEESSGYKEFSQSALKEVSFGINVNLQKREAIINLLKFCGYSSTKFYQAVLSKSKFEIEYYEILVKPL